jgi:hypothetical protein
MAGRPSTDGTAENFLTVRRFSPGDIPDEPTVKIYLTLCRLDVDNFTVTTMWFASSHGILMLVSEADTDTDWFESVRGVIHVSSRSWCCLLPREHERQMPMMRVGDAMHCGLGAGFEPDTSRYCAVIRVRHVQ